MSALNGISPNGLWSMYVFDDAGMDVFSGAAADRSPS
jgi:hypothetical protein